MTDTVKFKCKISNSDNQIPLGIEVLLDGQTMFKQDNVNSVCDVAFDINDDEASHKLQFVLSGKTHAHTKIDQQGNIVSDSLLNITQISIDDIELDNFVYSLSKYDHDFNGTKEPVTAKFYGSMGCNGTVTFEFTTPIYLWLLEHL